MLSEREVLRFSQLKGDFYALKDVVVVEEITNLYIDGNLYAVFHHSPSQIKELVIGHLLTEGIISGIEDILKIEFSEKNIHVELSKKPLKFPEKHRLITTFCFDNNMLQPYLLKAAQKLRLNRIKFSAEIILKSVDILNSKASIFKASGGTHAAALIYENGELIAFAEDIGRHNAVDKVIGEAAMKGVDFSRMLLASTGRLTSEIVIKAIQIGIPVLISLSAPTDMGIKIAKTLGLTLIGFARGKRFNVYTSIDRINEWNQRSVRR
jgi:FdhD protein